MGIIKRQYDTIDGRMIGYHSSGVQKDFLTDALGSVTAEVDQTCTKTFDGRYKPYGGDLSSTGSRGQYGWCGDWGYRETKIEHSSHYVQTRHYHTSSATWTSIDLVWPSQNSYGYVDNSPTYYVDPRGLRGGPSGQGVRGSSVPKNFPMNPPRSGPPDGHGTQPSPPSRGGNFPSNPPVPGGAPRTGPRQSDLDNYQGMGDGNFVSTCIVIGQGIGEVIDWAFGYGPHPVLTRPAVTSQECRDRWDQYHPKCRQPIPSCQGPGDCSTMRRELGAHIRECLAPRLWVIMHCDFPDYPSGTVRQTGKPWDPNPSGHIDQLCSQLDRLKNCLKKCPGLGFKSPVLDEIEKLCQARRRSMQ